MLPEEPTMHRRPATAATPECLIGPRITAIRKRQMTQVELAAALGMDQSLLSRYERGALVADLARVLHVTTDEVLGPRRRKRRPTARAARRPPHPGHRALAPPQERDPAFDHRLVPTRRHRHALTLDHGLSTAQRRHAAVPREEPAAAGEEIWSKFFGS
jgi:transcriptional regulator with XRE-family HTH domain